LDADVWEVSHHGSANDTKQAILDAITPQIATLGTGDPARTTGGAFTAFAFGHPREDAVDLILGSLTRKRPDIHVLAATGQTAFESIDVNEACTRRAGTAPSSSRAAAMARTAFRPRSSSGQPEFPSFPNFCWRQNLVQTGRWGDDLDRVPG